MKKKLLLSSAMALYAGAYAFAADVYVVNGSPEGVNSSAFEWSGDLGSASVWNVSTADTVDGSLYNVDSALSFAGLNIGSDKANTVNIVSGGSLSISGALSVSDSDKFKLALNGGDMAVGGDFSYADSDALSVSNGSSLAASGNIVLSTNANLSGAPADSSKYTLSGSKITVWSGANSSAKLTLDSGATLKASNSLAVGGNGTRDGSSSVVEILNGSSIQASNTTTIYSHGSNSVAGVLVSGENSSFEIASAQLTTRKDWGREMENERSYIEVADGASFTATGTIDFWSRVNLTNKSEIIVRNGSSATIARINITNNETGADGYTGASYFKIIGTGNTVDITDNFYNGNTGLKSLFSFEIDAGNDVSINRIESFAQYPNALRDADTSAFVEGARFLFNADSFGNVSTVKMDGALKLDSFIDLDFSAVSLEEGSSITGTMFSGFTSMSGLDASDVYISFDGEKWFSLDSEGKYADGIYEFILNSESNSFGYTLSRIPEPSTYAAIFGALALGFAIYRRRR